MKLATTMAFATLFTANVNAATPAAASKKDNDLSNKILFVEKEKIGSTYLSVVDPDGKNKRRLTPSMNNIMFPKYHPKSGWVAFTNQTDKMVSEIYFLNKAGTQLSKKLTNATFEDFSPDGLKFLYITNDEKAELFVYSMETKKATKISQDLKCVSASWSNDGEWIITSVFDSKTGTLDLYLISCLAQGIIKVTDTPQFNEAYPSFSNDNQKIAYFTNSHGENEIEILGVGAGQKIVDDKVMPNLANKRTMLAGTQPSFSPDDKMIAYQKGDEIFVSDINGLKPVKIANGKTPRWTK